MNKKERDELIIKYSPLVKNVVGRLTYKLPIDASDREGLVNVGIIGLMEALDKFDSTRNVQFETYARFRIRGAVLDELRSRDWVPRSVRHKDSKLEKAFHALKKSLGRPPTEEEVADYLGITLEQ
jgi:RNA polymerase sigma factor FliA